MSGRSDPSYAITIPKDFAKEMRIDTKKKAYVMVRLVKADGKNIKKAYCIIDKLER